MRTEDLSSAKDIFFFFQLAIIIGYDIATAQKLGKGYLQKESARILNHEILVTSFILLQSHLKFQEKWQRGNYQQVNKRLKRRIR